LRTKNNHVKMCDVKHVIKFIKQSIEELKKIQFPSRKETLRLTAYVIGVSIGAGLLITLFDYLFKILLTFILTK
jgi:preprotein translocase SecE subunit